MKTDFYLGTKKQEVSAVPKWEGFMKNMTDLFDVSVRLFVFIKSFWSSKMINLVLTVVSFWIYPVENKLFSFRLHSKS